MFKLIAVLVAFFASTFITGCFSSTEINTSTVAEASKELKPLTIERIDQTPDSLLVMLVMEHISHALPANGDSEFTHILSLPKQQQAIYIIWWLEGEVNNGGFNQYYYNSSGKFAKLAPEALKLVGAVRFAALTQSANDVYEKEKDNITRQQDGTSEGFSKSYEDSPLEKFDEEFYKLQEPLGDLQIAFIRKNKEAFVGQKTN